MPCCICVELPLGQLRMMQQRSERLRFDLLQMLPQADDLADLVAHDVLRTDRPRTEFEMLVMMPTEPAAILTVLALPSGNQQIAGGVSRVFAVFGHQQC